MIKNIIIATVLLLWTIFISLGVMQSVEREREIQELDRQFKEAVIETVNNGGCSR